MQNVWLYHINPKNRQGHTYSWKVDQPRTILHSRDKVWPAGNMFKKVAAGDLVCIYMKNIRPNPDGIYIVGSVRSVNPRNREFSWRPDQSRSARTLVSPIPPKSIHEFFGRGYGASMQRLDHKKQRACLRLLGQGEVTDGIPLLKVRAPRNVATHSRTDPEASREHGRIGELHVLKILRTRYPKSRGFQVTHVAAQRADADHDIAVMKAHRYVRFIEVKTRVGVPGDPVIISDRELACRRRNRRAHTIFVVYLGANRLIRGVLEIEGRDNFALAPRQFWLSPATA